MTCIPVLRKIRNNYQAGVAELTISMRIKVIIARIKRLRNVLSVFYIIDYEFHY